MTIVDKKIFDTLQITSRTARPVTKRIAAAAKEMAGQKPFKSEAGELIVGAFFVEYKRTDLKDGKPTPEFSNEIAAIGRALSAEGFSKKSENPNKSWANVSKRARETTYEGKRGVLITLVSKAEANEKAKKAVKKAAPRKATPKKEAPAPVEQGPSDGEDMNPTPAK